VEIYAGRILRKSEFPYIQLNSVQLFGLTHRK